MRKVLYILGQLTDRDVEWLASHGTRRRVAPGETLIVRGKQIDALFIVLSGEMSVVVEGIGEIARVKTGDILGEMSLIDASPPSATVTATAESKVLEIPKSAVNERMALDVEFAAHFYRAIAIFLSDRLRRTVSRLGYGGEVCFDEQIMQPDELDANVLDNVFLAGGRFDRMLKVLMGTSEAV